jgi:hypothetical protein
VPIPSSPAPHQPDFNRAVENVVAAHA